MSDTQSTAFQHYAFYLNCFIAAVALVGISVLESQPNIIEQLLHSVRLVDAVIFAAFGAWSRIGRVSAPLILFPYCIYLMFEPTMIDSPYRFAAMGVYVAVMVTAALSLQASWKAAQMTASQDENESDESSKS